jgi:hypothetical protein
MSTQGSAEEAEPQNPLQQFVMQAGVQFTPVNNIGAWTIVNGENSDGKKVAYAALVLTDVNCAKAYFFTFEMLKAFIQNSTPVLQQLLSAEQILNPLQMASLADLQALSGQNGSPGRPIEWPPKN